jgi:hypothetical protein
VDPRCYKRGDRPQLYEKSGYLSGVVVPIIRDFLLVSPLLIKGGIMLIPISKEQNVSIEFEFEFVS